MTVSQERIATTNQPAPQEVSCRHHWIIEPPNGATSLGECRLCEVCKNFPNSTNYFIDDKSYTLHLPISERPLSLDRLRGKYTEKETTGDILDD